MSFYSSLQTTELIKACAESDHSAAWQVFVARYQRQISLSIIRTVQRWGIAPQEVVDDLAQETYLKLCADRCRLLIDFSSRHPEAVEGYIKTIAINVAHDYVKAGRSRKRGKGEVFQFPEHLEAQAQPGGFGGEEAIQSAVLMGEINQCLEQCTAGPGGERDRLIFWLHYQQGMTASAIAALPGVGLTNKGVESAIRRLTKLVEERLIPLHDQAADTKSSSKEFGCA